MVRDDRPRPPRLILEGVVGGACAGRPAGNGRAPVKQKVRPRLAFEERNVEPGDGKGEKARARADARHGRRELWGGSAPAAQIDSVVQYSLHQQYPKYGSSIWPDFEFPLTSMGGAAPTVAGKGGHL